MMDDPTDKYLLPQFSFEQRPRNAPVLRLEDAYQAILRHNDSRYMFSLTEELSHEIHIPESDDIADEDGANEEGADVVRFLGTRHQPFLKSTLLFYIALYSVD